MKATNNNNGASAANNSNNWRNEANNTRERLKAIKPRSCWDKGVKGFALDLLESYENICEYCEDNRQPAPDLNEDTLLNGAAGWDAYCYDGYALTYDEDIARELCTPSELKRTNNGNKAPNSHETWMDVQIRAHIQAWALIENCM